MGVEEIPRDQTYSIQPMYNRCGKCSRCRSGGQGHGPYYYACWREKVVKGVDGRKRGGKMRKVYLGRELSDALRAVSLSTSSP